MRGNSNNSLGLTVALGRRSSLRGLVSGIVVVGSLLGMAELASAQVNVQTDTSWKVSAAAPPAGWNTQATFNDSAWANAVVNSPGGVVGTHTVDGIWDSANTPVIYLRKVFTTPGPATSAILDMAVDDDVQLWVNGTQVINNADCLAGQILGTDVLSHIVTGQNLIAAIATDCGGGRGFYLFMDVVTTAPVPALPSGGTIGLSLLLAAAAVLLLRQRSRVAGTNPLG